MVGRISHFSGWHPQPQRSEGCGWTFMRACACPLVPTRASPLHRASGWSICVRSPVGPGRRSKVGLVETGGISMAARHGAFVNSRKRLVPKELWVAPSARQWHLIRSGKQNSRSYADPIRSLSSIRENNGRCGLRSTSLTGRAAPSPRESRDGPGALDIQG